jgi:hypothetical protein
MDIMCRRWDGVIQLGWMWKLCRSLFCIHILGQTVMRGRSMIGSNSPGLFPDCLATNGVVCVACA